MTCAELRRELPELLEGDPSAKLQAHLVGCGACSELVRNLETIIREARSLQACEEPSPRVWNSIEIALRQEGLIRQPEPKGRAAFVPSLARRWGVAAWLVPSAALVLVGAFLIVGRQPRVEQLPGAESRARVQVTSRVDVTDQQLLEQLALDAPLMKAAYEKELNNVNEYIRDAQNLVDENPNDEGARQSLMDAYGQKAVIYQLALDRSLP
ncbi:MAG TPA: anti-sigma factor [Terriglobales bacterium]|nr:anti-sigma factor [Terriglobales bacterium]